MEPSTLKDMKTRFPKQMSPMLAAVLGCLALMSPGNEREAGQPHALKGALSLADNLQCKQAGELSLMEPLSWALSSAPMQPRQAVPSPDAQGWVDALRSDRSAFSENTMIQAPSVVESPVRARRRKTMLSESKEDEGLFSSDINVEQGWGWLAQDLRLQDKAVSQRESSRFQPQDEFSENSDTPFSSTLLDDTLGLERRRTFTQD